MILIGRNLMMQSEQTRQRLLSATEVGGLRAGRRPEASIDHMQLDSTYCQQVELYLHAWRAASRQWPAATGPHSRARRVEHPSCTGTERGALRQYLAVSRRLADEPGAAELYLYFWSGACYRVAGARECDIPLHSATLGTRTRRGMQTASVAGGPGGVSRLVTSLQNDSRPPRSR